MNIEEPRAEYLLECIQDSIKLLEESFAANMDLTIEALTYADLRCLESALKKEVNHELQNCN